MQRYRTITNITHESGRIGLTSKQATARRHLLIDQGNDVYLPKAPLQFKAGEIIDIDVVDKALAACLELLDPPGVLSRDVPGRNRGGKK